MHLNAASYKKKHKQQLQITWNKASKIKPNATKAWGESKA